MFSARRFFMLRRKSVKVGEGVISLEVHNVKNIGG